MWPQKYIEVTIKLYFCSPPPPPSNIYFTDQGLDTNDGTRDRRAAADRGPKIAVATANSHPYHEKTLHVAVEPYAIAVNPRKGYVINSYILAVASHLYMHPCLSCSLTTNI